MRKSKKEYLYSCVFKLFLSKHYELVTIKDIEEATGLTRGAVFYYVDTKQQLFCEVVDTYFFKAQELDDKLKELKEMDVKKITLLKFIHSYVQAVDLRMLKMQELLQMERAEASRAYLSFILQAQDYYPGFHERMATVFEKEQVIWETVLLSAQKNGEIKQNIDIDYFSKIFRYFYVGMCYQTSMRNGINPAELEIYFMSIYLMIKN